MQEVTETVPAVDGRRARGDRTRRAILGKAMQLASAEGLEDLSIARLSSELGMSKSGLFAHFGSKEELQLSTIRAARRVFSDEAVTPALAAKKGIERLDALLAAWHAYIVNDTFPGGCILMEAAAEFDNRPGPSAARPLHSARWLRARSCSSTTTRRSCACWSARSARRGTPSWRRRTG